jgi:hypothetical protein
MTHETVGRVEAGTYGALNLEKRVRNTVVQTLAALWNLDTDTYLEHVAFQKQGIDQRKQQRQMSQRDEDGSMTEMKEEKLQSHSDEHENNANELPVLSVDNDLEILRADPINDKSTVDILHFFIEHFPEGVAYDSSSSSRTDDDQAHRSIRRSQPFRDHIVHHRHAFVKWLRRIVTCMEEIASLTSMLLADDKYARAACKARTLLISWETILAQDDSFGDDYEQFQDDKNTVDIARNTTSSFLALYAVLGIALNNLVKYVFSPAFLPQTVSLEFPAWGDKWVPKYQSLRNDVRKLVYPVSIGELLRERQEQARQCAQIAPLGEYIYRLSAANSARPGQRRIIIQQVDGDWRGNESGYENEHEHENGNEPENP